ncbi:protein HEATR9 [Microcaecilia unicolor]|uniref:Protein HEATR9 n=1 Tax=Microcaecilia unicolor TaxID=1415580 RepID=A0A6P7YHH6_9AMPH|nr:protein HEATR9 [Microcaecilia unicolor]
MGVWDPLELRLTGQIEQVKLTQKRLERALESAEDGEWFQRAIELERECRQQVLLLQVTGRIHAKIRTLRGELSSAKTGRSAQKLQERVFQLECELDHILSRGRMYKSPSSEPSTEEETVKVDGTSVRSTTAERLSWKSSEMTAQSSEMTAQKEGERESFLEQCQEIGAHIGRVAEQRISECALQEHRLSSHQNPRQVFPADPSVWRRTTVEFTQPRIVVQPTLLNQNPGTFRRLKQTKEIEQQKLRLVQYSPLLHRYLFACDQQNKIIDREKDPPKWQRLKELSRLLTMAPREQDQADAAKALGYLGCRNDFVLSALHQALQVSQAPSVRYEALKALTLLGCLQAAVVKEMISCFRGGTKELIMDILIALKTTLQRWLQDTRSQGESLENEPSLTNALLQLLTSKDHLDDVSLEAAICLAHLATRNEAAFSTLMSFLSDRDMKKRMQALSTLVMCVGLHDAVTIQAALDQLTQSKVYKHRVEASYLLISIGLQQIRQEGLEWKVFDLLREKLYMDPVLAVRQAVAQAVESLQMKKLMYNFVEKQLEEQSEVSRIQAVMSLGVLGLRNQRLLRILMEMLDLDDSKEVRIQIIRLTCLLRLKDPYILRNLQLKEQGEGPLAREAGKALKCLRRIARAKGL